MLIGWENQDQSLVSRTKRLIQMRSKALALYLGRPTHARDEKFMAIFFVPGYPLLPRPSYKCNSSYERPDKEPKVPGWHERHSIDVDRPEKKKAALTKIH